MCDYTPQTPLYFPPRVLQLTVRFVLCCPLQVMEYYCESCETAMCLECTEGEHREHMTVPLRDVLEQHKTALNDQLDTVRNRYISPLGTAFRNSVYGSRPTGPGALTLGGAVGQKLQLGSLFYDD